MCLRNPLECTLDVTSITLSPLSPRRDLLLNRNSAKKNLSNAASEPSLKILSFGSDQKEAQHVHEMTPLHGRHRKSPASNRRRKLVTLVGSEGRRKEFAESMSVVSINAKK